MFIVLSIFTPDRIDLLRSGRVLIYEVGADLVDFTEGKSKSNEALDVLVFFNEILKVLLFFLWSL